MPAPAREHWFDSQLPRNPADMYYEAQLEDCDPAKNFVMVGGTNGASHLYQDIIAHFRSRGYCTLNFVPSFAQHAFAPSFT